GESACARLPRRPLRLRRVPPAASARARCVAAGRPCRTAPSAVRLLPAREPRARPHRVSRMSEPHSDTDDIPDIGAIIARAAGQERLEPDTAEAAFDFVMQGRATPVQIAALLVALRTRRESPAEVAGGVRALRRAMVPVAAADPDHLVDTCG